MKPHTWPFLNLTILLSVWLWASVSTGTEAGPNGVPKDAFEKLLESIQEPLKPLSAAQRQQFRELARTGFDPQWVGGNSKKFPCRGIVWMEVYRLTREPSVVTGIVPLIDRILNAGIPLEKAHVCSYTGKKTPYAFHNQGAVDIVSVAFNYAVMARVARTIVENRELHSLQIPAQDGRPAATCLERANAFLARCRFVLDYFKKESGWWNEREKRWSYEKLKAGDRLSGNGGYVAFNRYLMFDLARWDTACALKALDPVKNREWIEEAREVVVSGIELWKKSLIFKDHAKGRYAIFPYRITRRMEDTNHISWDLFPLARYYDDGLDVGRDNLRAVSNALVYVAIDEKGRPTRGIDGTATDGKGWRRYDFNTDCLVIANAAPDLFEQQGPPWIARLRETIKKDRMGALNEFIEFLVFQARYADGKQN